jgi:precorrin-2 dehydrogenase/sirohydrochlorin ferrochelatase
MLPLFLDVTGKRVVVVGGGPVGRRKAAAAAAAGAAVVVVDPRPLADLPGIEHVAEPYRAEHLAGARLVFAAAPPEVNARVAAEAAVRGIWVNTATDPAAGDVFVPAVVRSGGLTLAVGTGGAAPALARRVREKLEAEFDETFAEWVRLLDEARPLVLQSVADPGRRRALLDGFADWPWLARLRAEGADAVRAAMHKLIEGERGA